MRLLRLNKDKKLGIIYNPSVLELSVISAMNGNFLQKGTRSNDND
jgi:hypothetical protein